MNNCPEHNLLQQYFDGGLESVDFDLVGDHVESCAGCQKQLEGLANGKLESNDGAPGRCPPATGGPLPTGFLNRLADRLAEQCTNQKVSTTSERRPASQESESCNIPSHLGDYRVIREIGRGGMGIVYEAEQITLGRSVALKVLPYGLLQNANASKRFQREAAAAASLHHTNIVPVYEAGQDNGAFYYAMQLIEGSGLDVVRDEIRKSRSQGAVSTDAVAKGETEGLFHLTPSLLVPRTPPRGSVSPQPSPGAAHRRLPKEQSPDVNNVVANGNYYIFVADVGRQVASALDYAHNRGIIHRDVKPSNLILDANGIVWLADFGLAKQMDDGLTGTADAPGTLRYMAPERFKGQVDPSSDVYSLGASLYELLTLEPAFPGTDQFSLMEQIRNHEPQRPRALDRRIPLDLQTIVLKSMAREPSKRYPTARAMKEDLARFLDGQPILARNIGTAERLWRWAKKRKALAASLAVISLLIAGTAIASTVAAVHFRHQKIQQTELANRNLILAEQKAAESNEAIRQRDIARQNAYFGDIRQAYQDFENGQVLRMLTTLERYVPTASDKDIRGWEWFHLLSQAHRDRATITDFDGVVRQVEWSADGERLFSRGTDGTLRIWTRDGKAIRKISIPGLSEFALNPDSSQIATVSSDPVLRFWDAESGQLLRTIKTADRNLQSLDWSENGNQIGLIALSDQEAELIVLDAKSEAITWRRPLGAYSRIALEFSPNGKRLLVGFVGKGTAVFEIGTDDAINIVSQAVNLEAYDDFQTMCVAWHPDSRRFAVGGYQQGVRVLEVDEQSNQPKRLAHFQNYNSVDAIAFTDDGKQLIVGNRAQRVDIFDLESGEQIESYKGHLNDLLSVAVDPSGKSLASAAADGAIKIWDLSKNTNVQPAKVAENGSGTSPDGGWTWKQQESTVVITDTHSGEQLASLTGLQSETLSAKFFPKIDRVVFWDAARVHGPRFVTIWDTQTWKLERFLHGTCVLCPWASVAGDLFAVGTAFGTITVFNGRTGEYQQLKASFEHVAVALSPNSELMVSCRGGEVKLWDTQTGAELASFYGHRPGGYMPRLTWGKTGRYFATSSIDQTIKIWDAQDKKLVQTLRGLQSTPRPDFFSFSADDKRFLGSDSQSWKIWEIESGRELVSTAHKEQHPDSIYEKFQSATLQQISELRDEALRFAALEKANSLRENRKSVEQFEHQSLHRMARVLVTGTSGTIESPKRALALSARALELNPTDPEYLFTHSLAAYQAENFETALNSLKLATDSNFRNLAVIQFLKAICLKRIGKDEEAQQAYAFANETLDKSSGMELEFHWLVHEIAKAFIVPLDPNPSVVPLNSNPKRERGNSDDDDNAASIPRSRVGLRGQIKVTTLTDEIDGVEDGSVSLREAVMLIGNGGSIDFEVDGTIELKLGPIMIERSMTITGPGTDRLAISGGGKSRLLIIEDADPKTLSAVSISGVRLTRGYCAENIAGPNETWGATFGTIYVGESLTLTDCLIDGNKVPLGFGGGVYVGNYSTADMVRCSFVSNSSRLGGAIATAKYGKLGIDACTFEKNSEMGEYDGGGSAIYCGGDLRLSNSTFSNNKANLGGALSLPARGAVVRINHCTFTGNVGGAIYSYKYPPPEPVQWDIEATNCIFFGNTDESGRPLDVWAKDDIHAKISHSIIGVDHGGFIDGGNNLIDVDPKLGPLADNGGSTKTHALLEGSPAIDAGANTDRPSAIEFDQRGKPFKRVVDGSGDGAASPDIGAFEIQK